MDYGVDDNDLQLRFHPLIFPFCCSLLGAPPNKRVLGLGSCSFHVGGSIPKQPFRYSASALVETHAWRPIELCSIPCQLRCFALSPSIAYGSNGQFIRLRDGTLHHVPSSKTNGTAVLPRHVSPNLVPGRAHPTLSMLSCCVIVCPKRK